MQELFHQTITNWNRAQLSENRDLSYHGYSVLLTCSDGVQEYAEVFNGDDENLCDVQICAGKDEWMMILTRELSLGEAFRRNNVKISGSILAIVEVCKMIDNHLFNTATQETKELLN